MPAVLAIPAFWGAVGAAAAGTGTIVAAKMQSSAARSAANTTAAAANHAADLSSQANADALAFQKQQAESAYQSAESTRHANYDQWAASQRQRLSVGAALGLPGYDIPAYVPGVDPNLTGSAPGPSSPGGAPSVGQAAGAPPSSASSSGDPVQSFMLDLLHRGVAPQDVADQTNAKFGAAIGTGAKYYANNNTIGLPGFYVAGPQAGQTGNVWNVVTRGAGGPAPVGSVGDYAMSTRYGSVPIAPPVALPGQYPAGSIGSYLR